MLLGLVTTPDPRRLGLATMLGPKCLGLPTAPDTRPWGLATMPNPHLGLSTMADPQTHAPGLATKPA
jgi:hypothetical protein